MGECGGRSREVFKYVVENDHVEASGCERLLFDGAGEGVDAKGLAGKLDNRRAHLGAGRGESGPAQQGDVTAMGAAEFENPRRWEATGEQVLQPVGAALG